MLEDDGLNSIEERELKEALRRVEPREGFDQRVMARIHGGPAKHPVRRFTAWATAAAMTCASLAGVAMYRQNLEERKGKEARDQLVLALRITGKKLDAVRNTINQNEEANQTQ